VRLFFALWPPAPVAERLGALAADCAQRYGGRATRPDTTHLTLSFLGEVADDRLQRLIEAARGVDARCFAFAVDRLGYWPHNHLLWAGSASPPDALIELVARLRAALADKGFTEADPARDFAPHVTLVRRVPVAREAASPATSGVIEWPVTQFSLVESRPSRSGPAYRHVALFGLRT
jgi:2'-5' RNA ligase